MPHWDTADSDFDLVRRGAAYYDGLLDGLPDAAFAEPSALPDWTRGHVVAHVALNALALTRLVHWAATGVETPMYASPEARNADIAAHAAGRRRTCAGCTGTRRRRLRRGVAGDPARPLGGAGPHEHRRPGSPATRRCGCGSRNCGCTPSISAPAEPATTSRPSSSTGCWRTPSRCGRAVAVRRAGAGPDRPRRHAHRSPAAARRPPATGIAADLARWATGRGDAGVTSSAPVAVPPLALTPAAVRKALYTT